MRKEDFGKLHNYCVLALFGTALIMGLSFTAQKIGARYLEPFTFNTIRCFIGGLSLIPIVLIFDKLNKGINFSKSECIKGGILAGIVLPIAIGLNQYCIQYSQAGKAGFLTALYILFVPLIGIFFKNVVTLNSKVGIFLAILGMYMLCGKSDGNFEIWDIGIILSALFFAIHIMILAHYSRKANPIKLSCIQFFVAAFISGFIMLIFETPTIINIIMAWKPILFMGVVVTAGAYTLQTFGQKAVKPIITTLILSSESIFAVLGGMLILGETLFLKEVLGCVIMLAGIIISQLPTNIWINIYTALQNLMLKLFYK